MQSLRGADADTSSLYKDVLTAGMKDALEVF